jgi:hypothetical protein
MVLSKEVSAIFFSGTFNKNIQTGVCKESRSNLSLLLTDVELISADLADATSAQLLGGWTTQL